jgi:hypothetical protein
MTAETGRKTMELCQGLHSWIKIFLNSVYLPCDTNIESIRRNVRISGTCSLGMKTDVRKMFPVFYSSIETFILHTSGKVIRCETLHNERHLYLCIRPGYRSHLARRAVTYHLSLHSFWWTLYFHVISEFGESPRSVIRKGTIGHVSALHAFTSCPH